MERNGLNIMVFDQQSSFLTDQSRISHSALRRQTSTPGYDNLQQSEQIITNEIKMLHDKISQLQDKTVKLQQSAKGNIYPTSSSEISGSASNIQNNGHIHNLNSGQIEELLRVIEQKMQIVIKQTKKIIQKLTNDFDRKISQLTTQKNHEDKSVIKIQNHYQQTLVKIEEHYQKQLTSVQGEHSELENKLIQQVQAIEKQFRLKKREFQSKEQEYISTIQHLENKLKIANKNKKMLEVTQEKKNGVLKCNILENLSSNTHNASGMNGLPPPPPSDTSKTSKRRHRIFDGRGSNRSSISPNNQILSPLNPNKEQKHTQSVTKIIYNKHEQMPETQYSKNSKDQRFQISKAQGEKNIIVIPISSKNYESSEIVQNNMIPYSQQASQISYNSNFSQDPSSSNRAGKNSYQSQHSEKNISHRAHHVNNFVDASKSNQQNSKKTSMKKRKNDQFTKESPKGQWERFQDFNDHESSGSQQDVFFYPEHLRNQEEEPKVVFNYAQSNSKNTNKDSQKLFSPFDLS